MNGLVLNNMQGGLQLNVHQQSYIAKTKEEEIINGIIELARHGEMSSYIHVL